MATPYYEIPVEEYIAKHMEACLSVEDINADDSGVAVKLVDAAHGLTVWMDVWVNGDNPQCDWNSFNAGRAFFDGDAADVWEWKFMHDREAFIWCSDLAHNHAFDKGYLAQKEDATWVFDENGHAEDLV